MDNQSAISYFFGIFFLVALFGIACFMTFRSNKQDVPKEAMYIFRVILAISAAIFVGTLPGFMEIKGKVSSFALKATSGFAVLILVYCLNPPVFFKEKLPTPKKPKRVIVPADKRKKDEAVK